METIGKIRRRRLVQGESISAIARDLRLSRNTVKKALRIEGEAFEYRRKRQPQPKLGPFLPLLDQWLEADAKLPARERRTAQRLYEGLQLEGYTGAVDGVRRHVRRYAGRERPAEAFIPQRFAPGEAYQFDWSHEHVELGGEPHVVKVAHLRLCYSRAFLMTAYPRETQEMLFDGHARAFAFLGGIPRRGIYDNLKAAVDTVFVGKARTYNRRFLAMCNHYLVDPTACTPAAGWEKGQVENQVGNGRSWLFTPKPKFADLAALNAWLMARCLELTESRPHPDFPERRVAELWAEERALLRPYRLPFDGFHERCCRVTSTALVHFERNRYSVDCRHVGRTVALRAYADRIVILADGEVIGEHSRSFARYQFAYNPWHYVAALARKARRTPERRAVPGLEPARRPDAAARTLGAPHRRRSPVRREILAMVPLYGLDAVAGACATALDERVVSSAHVVNLLHRAAEAPRATALQVPEALVLREEPAADCQRYDRLLTRLPAVPLPVPAPEEIACKPN